MGHSNYTTVLLVLVSSCLLQATLGLYFITTPRKWTVGAKTQVCMGTSSPTPEDKLLLTVTSSSGRHGGGGFWREPPSEDEDVSIIIPERTIVPVNSDGQNCDEITVPYTTHRAGKVTIVGSLGGVDINETRQISFGKSSTKTFVQTDKYLYKAGQTVQFRVLTIAGPFLQISTDTYPEVFVETPSGSRIAQWLNVSNPSGLVHLDMQLIEEPEEGVYSIKVRGGSGKSDKTTVKTFKIEDYVLPRFEVTLTPPKYVLADADVLKMEVCAKYTFGQPVRGNLTINLHNNGWRRNKIEMKFTDKITGCKDVEVPLRTFGINNNDNFVYSLNADVDVEEEGTGNVISDQADIKITRTVLTFKDEDDSPTYTKPELPYSKTITVSFPDGAVAAAEPMSVCVDVTCRNVTTDHSGRLTYIIPPHLTKNSPMVKSINYPNRHLPGKRRNYMYESTYYSHFSKYYSPTNSSLHLQPGQHRLLCPKGEKILLALPVQYAAVNTSHAEVFVQVVSRGQIQYWKTVEVQFGNTGITVDESSLIAPIQPPLSPFTQRGQFVLSLELPPTVSPNVHVVVWYTREDREVVSDSQKFTIEKCLDHQVGLSWPKAKVEQGTTLPLTLTAQPDSLCSLGIVDKSVELLSGAHDSLTLDTVFRLAEEAEVNAYENSQIDDYAYCTEKNKKNQVPDEGVLPPLRGPVPEPIPLPVAVLPADPPAPIAGPPAPPAPPPQLLGEEVRDKRSSPPGGFYGGFSTDFVDAIKFFDISGIYFISDLTTETRPCRENYGGCPGCRGPGGGGAFGGGGGFGGGDILFDSPPLMAFAPAAPARPGNVQASAFGGGDFEDTENAAVASAPRTYFPETWLWELTTLPSTGTHVQELTLPDTITEWVGKAVCVHPSKGLGISRPTSITTFTPFFIDLTVLPNVKKGEIMPIKVSVFNYLESSLPVRITLEASPDYDILDSTNSTETPLDQAAAGTRSVCIPSNDKQTVTIRLRPQAVGQVNVTVTAVVDAEYPEQCGPELVINKVDRIISPITVEYEGFPREKTWTKYMCSKDINENLDFFSEWHLEAPANIVPESERAWVTVVGDLLGPTLENLGHLIRMPYGCGEQNMLNFAPNIFVQQYLEASSQTTEASTTKLVKFMRSGYRRELKYKHSDGSYSAFGESDNSGSTWLTAFVVKSFAQSQQYIDVDQTELNMSRDWLKNRQLENGCFESVGKVLHKGMKGGLSEGGRPKVLAAYVLAALLEAGEDTADKVISNAVFCLQGTSPDAKTAGSDPYELSLIAYALNLAQLPEGETALQKLINLAVDTPAGLHWKLRNSNGGDHGTSASAVEVETAGYVLMAMLAHDPSLYTEKTHRIVKWISAQRNSQGGFISTQDTVVALQALAMYEKSQDQEPLNLMVSVTGQDLAATFKVEESNKLLTQRIEVDVVPNDVMLDMAGSGCTLVQAVVRYNVNDPEPSEAFSMSVSTSLEYGKNSCKKRTIKACASYLLNDGASNMAVIEVTLVSGFIPVKDDLKKIVKYGTGIIKRYEVDGSKVMFYIDQFTARETCVKFSAIEEVKVENAKPGTVKVYDYYEPEFVISEKYEFPRRWFCRDNEPEIVVPLIEDDIILALDYSDAESTTDVGSVTEPVPEEAIADLIAVLP